MYCSKCGQPIAAGSTFCNHCGQTVVSDNDFSSTHHGDFITLKCPNCGGKLQVNPNSGTLVCSYCGFEHIVRHDGASIFLEAYARCPTCHRNDKVVKATLKHGRLTEPHMYLESTESRPCSYYILSGFIGIVFIVFFFLLTSSDPGMSYFFLGCGAFFLIFPSIAWLIKGWKNHQIDKRNIDLTREYNEEKARFVKTKEIWENTYYCERDSTFFNIKTSQPLSKDFIEEVSHYWKIGSNDLFSE
jgi:predicted RNA-binding Zn-ribbon protein involved in translation (DUF1610 family)